MKRRWWESLSERRQKLLGGMGQSSPRISCWSPLSLSVPLHPSLRFFVLRLSAPPSRPLLSPCSFIHHDEMFAETSVYFCPSVAVKWKKKNANSANKSRFLCIWYPKTACYYIIQQIKMTKASKSSLYSVYHKIRSSICRRRFGMHEVRVCE